MSDVQDRLERLRKAGRLRRRRPAPDAQTPPRVVPALDHPPVAQPQDLLDLPGMEEISGPAGTFLLRTVRYDLAHRQGDGCLCDLLDLPVGVAHIAARDPALDAFDFRRVLFIDTETSGLAGGAGTIVFLTGVGFFEEDGYVVRQYFARHPGEEPAYLHHLADLLDACQGYVSFNGKSFDLPLLRSRFLLAGLAPPPDLPHLDLLHPARRLWRTRLGGCHFGNLEANILGFRRSGDDVPSYLIPDMWFRFARGGGNTGDMAGVLYHNLEDIVSMVPLAYAVCGTFGGHVAPHPGDVPALARSHAAQGRRAEAETLFRQALDGPLSRQQRFEVMTGLAAILKKQHRRDQAALWWEALVELAPPDEVDPHIELAKYHEWETGDLDAARRWTELALTQVRGSRFGYPRNHSLAELEHRLGRLQRKLGEPGA